MQVRARNGYWAPRGADIDRARAIALAATLPSPVAKAFKELTPDNSRRAGRFLDRPLAGADNACDVNVAWTPRPGHRRARRRRQRGRHRDERHRAAVRGAVKDGGVSFTCAAGHRAARFHDPRQHRRHDRSRAADDHRPRSSEDDAGADDAGPVARAQRRRVPQPARPRRSGRLRRPRVQPHRSPAAARRCPTAPRRPTPKSPRSWSARAARTLAELPIHAEGEGGGFRLDLPLSSLATGEFLIAIAARTPPSGSKRSCR